MFIHELTATVQAPACALSAADGQIRATGQQGVFVSDVRVLTQARLRLGGAEPHGLTRSLEGPGRARFIGVAHGSGDPIPDPTVRVERVRQMKPTGMTEELRISSTATRTVSASVTMDLRCDLTPLPLVRAGRSEQPVTAVADGASLSWASENVTITASADGGVAESEQTRLVWQVELAPGQAVTLRWSLGAVESRPVLVSPRRAVEWSRPRISGDDPRLARLLNQSLDDLESLRLAEPTDPDSTFIGAGVPWFLTLFGRDSIWSARMMLPLGTALAAGTLRALARRQGTKVDTHSAEAPGKIMHELRPTDIRVGQDSASPAAYYGTIDATLLWISLLADAWRWGLPETTVSSLLPHLHRALSWLALHGDPDGDGFIEYIDHSGRGLANQGWKDSGDAVRFHDGRMAVPPIALCEVQGYAHRAALDGAALLEAFGEGKPDRWRQYASDLADRFRARFWADGPLGPYPALALDVDARRVDSLTSNIGHLLGTGILNTDEEAIVAGLLASPAMAGGYGLRTMSTLDAAYSPLSYHCGSVWPHDTAIAVLGLANSGAHAAAAQLVQGLLAAAEAVDFRLPELYSGDARDDVSRPIPYPDACRPQAWSAAAAVSIVQAMLGLAVDAPRREVRVSPVPGLSLATTNGFTVAGHPVGISVTSGGDVTVSGLPPTFRLSKPSRQRL